MGNKRQREARKRFLESQGQDISGQKRPREEGDVEEGERPPTKKKLKKEAWKKKIAELKAKTARKLLSKGKGQRCRVCDKEGHWAKDCPDKAGRHKICLMCRGKGHTIRDCPKKGEAGEEVAARLCYNCGASGENGHRLADCPHPRRDGGTSFAICFVCKERGHLSSACPSNEHGIYPKGGSCKYCNSVRHLAKDCPEKSWSNGRGQQRLHIASAGASAEASRPNKKTVFQSGDDLEDDFGNIADVEGNRSDANDAKIDDEQVGSLGEAVPRVSVRKVQKTPRTIKAGKRKVVSF